MTVTFLSESYPNVAPGSTGWQDVDCSAYIPATATGVIMRHYVSGSGPTWGYRNNGSGDTTTTSSGGSGDRKSVV
jgi:hypothetical protein